MWLPAGDAGCSVRLVGNIAEDSLHIYSYDADGNLISVDNGQTATYSYDSLNQRVQVAPTRGTYEFVWDIFGRRVSTWAASNHGFVESNAYTDSGAIAIRSGGQTQFEHQNWLGTERVRTSYDGSTAISIGSLPWGDGHTPTGDNGDQHDFATLDRDLEDNTEHAQYRQYSTNLGRWQSPDLNLGSYDLTNPQSFDRYTYALNDPANLTDPSGLAPTCTIDPEANLLECTSYYPANPPPTGCISFGTQGCIPQSCGSIFGCDGPPLPGSTGTGTSSGTQMLGPPGTAILSAPSNGPTKGQCLGQALKSDGNGVSLALDVAGLGAGFCRVVAWSPAPQGQLTLPSLLRLDLLWHRLA